MTEHVDAIKSVRCVSVAIMMYLRYRQVAEYLTTTDSVHHARANKVSLIVGLLAAFGMTIVANFQVCACKHTSISCF